MMFIFLLLLSTFSLNAKAFDWQGHRGARGLYPENTVNGMKVALKFPITTLEMDVVISKDKKVIVSHEPWMNPEICSTKKINLYQLTAKEIESYDCGKKGHPRFPDQKNVSEKKPLLKDLINEMEKELKTKGSSVNYNIEIKSSPELESEGFQPAYQEFTDLVIKLLKDLLPENRYMIQSFDWRVLKYLHLKYPQIKVVALRESRFKKEEILKELGFAPQVFSPHWVLLKKEDIAFFKGKGIKVIPWTVNEVKDMELLRQWGVDGIITDFPNLIPGP